MVMMVMVSLAFAVGGVMLGEMWSWAVEGYRVGNSHMSYRAERLIWSRHRGALFVRALVLFWVVAGGVGRRMGAGASYRQSGSPGSLW